MYLVRVLHRLLALGALAWAVALPAAPVDDAKTALVAGIDEVSAALRERPKQDDLIALLDTLVDKHFAFGTTTRLAVGPAWRDFSDAQQTRAVQLFSGLVIRTYAARIGADTKPEITYGVPVELRPGRVEIPTLVKSAGQTYAVAYRMELDRDVAPARWRVYDVVAEGVSLIANYRSQFDPIVKKSGADGLLKTIETKLAEPVAPPAPPPAR
jgi:phospholipid transport system substrate-binding protein